MGNADVAPFSAMLIIVFTIMLYHFSLFFLAITFIHKEYMVLTTSFFKNFSVALFFSLIAVFYFILVHKGKYKKILIEHEKREPNKGKWFAILFALTAFVLFNLGFIIKILQNQGRL